MKYSYAISTLALLAALGACSDSSDSSLGPDGTTGAAPATRLVAVSPPGQATGVDRGGPLMLQFDGAMMPGMEQYVDLHRGDVSSLTHPIACAWSADAPTRPTRWNRWIFRLCSAGEGLLPTSPEVLAAG